MVQIWFSFVSNSVIIPKITKNEIKIKDKPNYDTFWLQGEQSMTYTWLTVFDSIGSQWW